MGGGGGVGGLHKAGLSQFKMDLMAHGTAQLQLQSLHLSLYPPLALALLARGVTSSRWPRPIFGLVARENLEGVCRVLALPPHTEGYVASLKNKNINLINIR